MVQAIPDFVAPVACSFAGRPPGYRRSPYERLAGVPPERRAVPGPDAAPGEPARDHAHAHDFLVLAYFERGGGSLRVNGRGSPIAAGDAFVFAPQAKP
jgi:hypothetical protein